MSLASILSLIFSVVGAYRFITKTFAIHPLKYARTYYLKVLQATFAMEISCIMLFLGLSQVLTINSKMHSVILVSCISLAGALVFLGIVFGKNMKSMLLNFLQRS
jgi:hypothetical protein